MLLLYQVPVEDMMMGVTALVLPPPPAEVALEESTVRGTKVRFTWRLENFAAFRTILDSRKVFSRWPSSPLLPPLNAGITAKD